MSTNGNDDGLPDKARLAELVAEAVVDCYDEEEQLTGLFTMIEENLALPFATRVLGVEVTVESVDLTDDDRIVAGCRRGRGAASDLAPRAAVALAAACRRRVDSCLPPLGARAMKRFERPGAHWP